MRKVVLSIAAASAILAAASVTPANALSLGGTEAAIQSAIADEALVQDAAYVCRHRWRSSRRVCWWTPGYRRYHRRYRW